MSQTEENLQAAFAGESQAHRRYLAFAEQADQEGHAQIARLFRAAASAEAVHAGNHLGAMGTVGSTTENLQAAIHGEDYEFTKMYPEFIGQAEADDNPQARETFSLANRVEKVHHQLFQNALTKLRSGAQFTEFDFYVCGHCGNTVAGEPPAVCPVCGRPREQFKKVE